MASAVVAMSFAPLCLLPPLTVSGRRKSWAGLRSAAAASSAASRTAWGMGLAYGRAAAWPFLVGSIDRLGHDSENPSICSGLELRPPPPEAEKEPSSVSSLHSLARLPPGDEHTSPPYFFPSRLRRRRASSLVAVSSASSFVTVAPRRAVTPIRASCSVVTAPDVAEAPLWPPIVMYASPASTPFGYPAIASPAVTCLGNDDDVL
mmetsp:Transcript_28452/g.83683  ORF Transcript_28452/g.83683 Transcript_28452/m.83683 type:complete len:205 (+) Transcript_28452:2674-3288(+)